MTTDTMLHDDGEGPCPQCEEPSIVRTCAACGRSARIIDCGHKAQPRPIAAGREDGSDGHHDYCSACSALPACVAPVGEQQAPEAERLCGEPATTTRTVESIEAPLCEAHAAEVDADENPHRCSECGKPALGGTDPDADVLYCPDHPTATIATLTT